MEKTRDELLTELYGWVTRFDRGLVTGQEAVDGMYLLVGTWILTHVEVKHDSQG